MARREENREAVASEGPARGSLLVSRIAPFPVLVAANWFPDARAAVTLAVAFPWPPAARATGMVARDLVPVGLPREHRPALETSWKPAQKGGAVWARPSVPSNTTSPASAATPRRAVITAPGAIDAALRGTAGTTIAA